jgi:hypothetical protein
MKMKKISEAHRDVDGGNVGMTAREFDSLPDCHCDKYRKALEEIRDANSLTSAVTMQLIADNILKETP